MVGIACGAGQAGFMCGLDWHVFKTTPKKMRDKL
jgi:hypothetical protein